MRNGLFLSGATFAGAINAANLSRSPQKDRQLVVHPEVDQHMGQHKEGRKRSLKTLLSLSQCRLIELDFLEALEEYDARSITGELSMWRALEASRYCSTNPAYKEARADVNVAARLLVLGCLGFRV